MPTSKESVIKSLIGIKNLGATTLDTAYDEFGLRTLDDLIALAESGKLATIKGVGPVRAKSVLASAKAMKANPPKPKAKGTRGRKPGSKNKPKGATAKTPVAAKTAVDADAVPPMVRPGGKKDAAVAATPIVKPKKRGRPKKEVTASTAAAAPAAAPKKRGRPKKEVTASTAAAAPPAAPKKRGRPKKVVETPVAAKKERNKPGPKPGKGKGKADAPKAEAPRAEAPRAERPRSTYTPPAPQKSSNPVVFLGKLVFKIAKKLLS